MFLPRTLRYESMFKLLGTRFTTGLRSVLPPICSLSVALPIFYFKKCREKNVCDVRKKPTGGTVFGPRDRVKGKLYYWVASAPTQVTDENHVSFW